MKGVDEERCKGGLVEQKMRASLKVSVIDKTSRSRGGGGCRFEEILSSLSQPQPSLNKRERGERDGERERERERER